MNKTIIAIAAASAALFATTAMAGEVDTFCALNTAQAQVQSELLGAAEAFTNVGDPATGSHTITAGVRKSLSKHYQANLVDKLAQAQCDAYRLENKLTEQVSNVEQRGDLLALNVLEPLLKKALEQANANVKQEQAMLEAHTGRLTDVKAAFEQADQLRADLANIVQRRSRLQDQLPALDVPLGALVDEAVSARAEVAALSSKIAAQSGWDVQIAGGVRNDFRGNGQREGFIAITASYSLGKPAADRAASKVAALTEQLLNEQRDASTQGLRRAKNTVDGLLGSENLILQGLEARKTLADSTLARLQGVDTEDGLRALRSVKVEQLTVDAQIAASRARIQYLKGWMQRNS